jgi:hypothetical protein
MIIRNFLKALAILAVVVAVFAPSVNANDVCSDASELDLNQNYYEYIDPSGDVDWYKWYIPSPGLFTAFLDVPASKDYDLEVYAGCSDKVCSSTNGGGSDEECSLEIISGGWIRAKLYGYGGDNSGSDEYYIEGAFQPYEFDLVVEDIYTVPSSLDDETTFDLNWAVKNSGKDDINGAFKSKLYINGVLKFTCNHDAGADSGKSRFCTWGGQYVV